MRAGYSLRGHSATNGGVSTGEAVHALVQSVGIPGRSDTSLCGVECVAFKDSGADDFDLTAVGACRRCSAWILKRTPAHPLYEALNQIRYLVAATCADGEPKGCLCMSCQISRVVWKALRGIPDAKA